MRAPVFGPGLLLLLLCGVLGGALGRGLKFGERRGPRDERCATGSCDASLRALADAAGKGESVSSCGQCYVDGYSHCVVVEERRPLEDVGLCQHQVPLACALDVLPGLRPAALCRKAVALPALPAPALRLINASTLTFRLAHLAKDPFWRSLDVSDYAFFALYNPKDEAEGRDCQAVAGDADFLCQAQVPAELRSPNASEFTVHLPREHFPKDPSQAYGVRYSVKVRRGRELSFRRSSASVSSSEQRLWSPTAPVYRPKVASPEASSSSAAAWLLPLLACLSLAIGLGIFLRRTHRWPFLPHQRRAKEPPAPAESPLLKDQSPEVQELRELLGLGPMVLEEQVALGEAVGSGRFGPIRKGQLTESEARRDVLAQSCESPWRMSRAELRDFLVLLDASVRAGQHPNLLGLAGLWDGEETALVCVEEGSGPNLQTLLRESRTLEHFPDYAAQHGTASLMTPSRLFALMSGVTRGAAHLEERDVVHPHLAAVNVVIGEGGVPKVAGFGFSALGELFTREAEGRHSATRWLAPEALAALSVAPASVQLTTATTAWSLGMILWEILTLGGTPYHELPTAHLRTLVLRAEIAPSQPPHVSDALYEVLSDCWKADPSHRATAMQTLQALQDLGMTPQDHIDLRTVHNTFPYTPIQPSLEEEL